MSKLKRINPVYSIIFISIALSFCKLSEDASLTKDVISSQNSEGSFDITEYQGVGPDKPTVGRSLFDYLTIKKNSQGQYVQDIPYPLPKLLEKISPYMKGNSSVTNVDGLGSFKGLNKFSSAMFPKGRSLQRRGVIEHKEEPTKCSYPFPKTENDFFAYPRVVVAATKLPNNIFLKNAPYQLDLDITNKLYLGLNELTQELEVISYNPVMGRFEYQLVKNYRPDMQKKGCNLPRTVQYAKRGVCLSCHQNQAPMFSRAPWNESNLDRKPVHAGGRTYPIHRMISHVRTKIDPNNSYKNQYMGLPIRASENDLLSIDLATDQANQLIPAQVLWRDGCNRSNRCRALAFLLALSDRFSSENDNIALQNYTKKLRLEYRKLSAQGWSQNFSRNLGLGDIENNIVGKIAFRNADLCNRDIFYAPTNGTNIEEKIGGGIPSTSCDTNKVSNKVPRLQNIKLFNLEKGSEHPDYSKIFQFLKADYALASILDPLSPRGNKNDNIRVLSHYGESSRGGESFLVDVIASQFLTKSDIESIFHASKGKSNYEKYSNLAQKVLSSQLSSAFSKKAFNRYEIMQKTLKSLNYQASLPNIMTVNDKELPSIILNRDPRKIATTAQVNYRHKPVALLTTYCGGCHYGSSEDSDFSFLSEKGTPESKIIAQLKEEKANIVYRLNYENSEKYLHDELFTKNPSVINWRHIRASKMPGRALLLRSISRKRYIKNILVSAGLNPSSLKSSMVAVQDLMSHDDKTCEKPYIRNLGATEECKKIRPYMAKDRKEILNFVNKL